MGTETVFIIKFIIIKVETKNQIYKYRFLVYADLVLRHGKASNQLEGHLMRWKFILSKPFDFAYPYKCSNYITPYISGRIPNWDLYS